MMPGFGAVFAPFAGCTPAAARVNAMDCGQTP